MGDYRLTFTAAGPHGGAAPTDAEQLAKLFAAELTANGHHVYATELTVKLEHEA
jgi:hypothetical protein